MNLDQLPQLSIEQWKTICGYPLPAGHREGWHWRAGSSFREPGRSVDINLRAWIHGD